jgi:DnaK suppressor protein
MNKRSLKKIIDVLTKERQELIDKNSNQVHEVDVSGDEIDEIQGNLLLSMASQLTIRNTARIANINEALRRIAEGSYGTCEDCEEDIPEKRLLANMQVKTCVFCAEVREKEAKSHAKRTI